jgi:membrane protease subunit HflC
MSQRQPILFILFALIAITVYQSAFIVRETDRALVLRFGELVNTHTEPGLKFKTPFIENVSFFDKRALDIDPMPEQVILADQKRIVVDTFARYRITDALQFYKTLRTEQQANSQLNNVINSTLRSTLGTATLADVLSDKRAGLMQAIKKQVNASATPLGVEIVDVRIGRADLPDQTSQSIYARMKTEREREAAEFRAQGQEQAQEIRSKADKERTILLATAEKQAQITRGLGDETAIRTYAAAFQKDPEFYSFYRSMEAYKKGLPGDNTTLILSPEGDFFRYFNDNKGGR